MDEELDEEMDGVFIAQKLPLLIAWVAYQLRCSQVYLSNPVHSKKINSETPFYKERHDDM